MEILKKLLARIPRKLIYVLVGMGLAAIAKSRPDWPLPSVDLVTDLILALLAAHTLTDVVAIIKTTPKALLEDLEKKPAEAKP